MARKYQGTQTTGKTILLVDDSKEYLEATRKILEREGHSVLVADSGPMALRIIKRSFIDLLLLDYFMPNMTGEQVVEELRKFNKSIQIILQTGYSSEKPPRDMIKRLDIQGYYDKSEGPDKLLLWTDVGLKAAYAVQLLEKSRKGLSFILSATPELYKLQPYEDLLHGILWQISGLLSFTDSFLAVLPAIDEETTLDSFLSMHEGEEFLLKIHAGVGRFFRQKNIGDLIGEEEHNLIKEALQKGKHQINDVSTAIPLQVGKNVIGVIYLGKSIYHQTDLELVSVFANQAAVAIQNSQLFEMATIDPLTGVYIRRFYNQWIVRELKNSLRNQHTLCLLMLDMDGMKEINDQGGHLTGDKALVQFSKTLKNCTRSSDLVCRFGGDEFSILLPHTNEEGMKILINRISCSLKDQSIVCSEGSFPLKASIGGAILHPEDIVDFGSLNEEYFQALSRYLQDSADMSLYEAKKKGGNCAGNIHILRWPDPEGLPIEEIPQ